MTQGQHAGLALVVGLGQLQAEADRRGVTVEQLVTYLRDRQSAMATAAGLGLGAIDTALLVTSTPVPARTSPKDLPA